MPPASLAMRRSSLPALRPFRLDGGRPLPFKSIAFASAVSAYQPSILTSGVTTLAGDRDFFCSLHWGRPRAGHQIRNVAPNNRRRKRLTSPSAVVGLLLEPRRECRWASVLMFVCLL